MDNLYHQLYDIGEADLLKENLEIRQARAGKLIMLAMSKWWRAKKRNE
jgi:hypothetical protein